MPTPFPRARAVIAGAVAQQVFPAAVIEVGSAHVPLWREPFGRLTYAPAAAPAADDTIFDLASLTKVLSTTALVMRQVERGGVGLDDPVGRYVAQWRGPDRDSVTVRDLLSHSSGLPAHRHFYRELSGRAAFEAEICRTPLEYAPRSASVYSDLGFMLLGFLLEDVAPLPAQFDAMRVQMGGIQELQFHPPGIWKPRTAPTQQNAWRNRLLVGEVDDDNTWALGGAAGQAGLFGTAGAVGECARHLLQVLEGRSGAFRRDTLETFIARRGAVPGSRALGWDTMLPTSSCGTRMSPRAFGHTGFTGTSLWIDPDRGAYVVLLTNRVHPTPGDAGVMREVRRAVHDAVVDSW